MQQIAFHGSWYALHHTTLEHLEMNSCQQYKEATSAVQSTMILKLNPLAKGIDFLHHVTLFQKDSNGNFIYTIEKIGDHIRYILFEKPEEVACVKFKSIQENAEGPPFTFELHTQPGTNLLLPVSGLRLIGLCYVNVQMKITPKTQNVSLCHLTSRYCNLNIDERQIYILAQLPVFKWHENQYLLSNGIITNTKDIEIKRKPHDQRFCCMMM